MKIYPHTKFIDQLQVKFHCQGLVLLAYRLKVNASVQLLCHVNSYFYVYTKQVDKQHFVDQTETTSVSDHRNEIMFKSFTHITIRGCQRDVRVPTKWWLRLLLL